MWALVLCVGVQHVEAEQELTKPELVRASAEGSASNESSTQADIIDSSAKEVPKAHIFFAALITIASNVLVNTGKILQKKGNV